MWRRWGRAHWSLPFLLFVPKQRTIMSPRHNSLPEQRAPRWASDTWSSLQCITAGVAQISVGSLVQQSGGAENWITTDKMIEHTFRLMPAPIFVSKFVLSAQLLKKVNITFKMRWAKLNDILKIKMSFKLFVASPPPQKKNPEKDNCFEGFCEKKNGVIFALLSSLCHHKWRQITCYYLHSIQNTMRLCFQTKTFSLCSQFNWLGDRKSVV